jgi:hypothetical protein
MKENLVLSYYVNQRSLFTWPAHPLRLEEYPYCLNKGRLLRIDYSDDKVREKDVVKHIWVKRMKDGTLSIAPGVRAHWDGDGDLQPDHSQT